MTLDKQYPELWHALAAAYYRDSDESWLDPRQAFESTLNDRKLEGELKATAAQLRMALGGIETEAELENRYYELGVDVGPPEGNSWAAWSRWLQRRLDEAAENPASVPNEYQEFCQPRLPRTSRFFSEDAANDVATSVLREHEDAVRAWAADTGGWWRLHLYADLGSPTGVVRLADVDDPVTATAAVVLMKMNYADGVPFIATTYPEVTLDEGIRARWPDLCQVFGGYFGQDWSASDGTVWSAQRHMLSVTRAPARDRMRGQLDELLTVVGDEEFRAALHALGSYVLPVDARVWVERMRWRMDAFDWRSEPA